MAGHSSAPHSILSVFLLPDNITGLSFLRNWRCRNHGLIEEGRRIPVNIYFSIFNDAVNLKEFSWASEFSGISEKYLPGEDLPEINKLTRLILNFFSKNYLELHEQINSIKKTNTRQYVYSRYIKMMVLYEFGNLKSVQYECDSFKQYLYRKKKSKTTAVNLINNSNTFNRCMRKLAELSHFSQNSDRNEYLKHESAFYKFKKPPEYAFWFEEKIRELDKQNRKMNS